MKKLLLKKIFLAVGWVLFFYLAVPQALAQGPQAEEPLRVEIAELGKTIQLLENPGEAKKLAAQLRGLLEAQKLASEKEKQEVPETESGFLDLLELYESREEQISRIGERITEFLESLRESVRCLLPKPSTDGP